MEEDYTIIEQPTNITDIYVQFDPQIEKPDAVKLLHTEKSDSDEMVRHESYKTDGFDTPIVVINQQVIPEEFIESLEFRYTKFTPTVELVVNDIKNDIQYIGGPGLHNHVVVILCPNVDGIYRSIACIFYIKDRINETDSRIRYVCEYHNIGLTDIACTQIGSKTLTTYEFCEEMAKKLGLGFACTDKCKDISDARWRQMYSQRTSDFIQQQIGLGGLDEDSFFDCWIDTHGYLNLINLSWVLSADIKAENLSIATQHRIDVPVKDAPEGEPYETQRTISDIQSYPIEELKITRKYSYLNTETVKNLGTDTSFWCLQSAGDENKIEIHDVKMIEDSIEGKAEPEQYTFRKFEFLGCDMDEDLPYMLQEQTRKHWMEKRKSKQLVVHLDRPNFGLERGMLINAAFIEENPAHVRRISQNFENTVQENKKDGENYTIDDTKPPVDVGDAASESMGILNPALSGMYYINGMLYNYSQDIGKVEQVLFLIKKSSDNALFHAKSSPTITTEQAEELDKYRIYDK